MEKGNGTSIGRRELLVRTAPACAMACLSMGKVSQLAAAVSRASGQDQHKFDAPLDSPPPLTQRRLVQLQNQGLVRFIRTLQQELDEPEVIRLLNVNADGIGRRQGEGQARMLGDRNQEPSFEAFGAQFRPPRYASSLTHEVVEDSEEAFELKVTECVWAEVFREAGLGGEVGHAAVCRMDYNWPTSFNPTIRMERSKTLMQGDECCNHRYVVSPAGFTQPSP